MRYRKNKSYNKLGAICALVTRVHFVTDFVYGEEGKDFTPKGVP
jgi:hypothetical protein